MKKEFRVLKGVVYKNGQVPTMLIDVAGKSKWTSDDVPSNSTEQSTLPTPLPSPTVSNDAKYNSSQTALVGTVSCKCGVSESVHLLLPLQGTNAQSAPAVKKGFLNKVTSSSTDTQVETHDIARWHDAFISCLNGCLRVA